jgi:uncharacterized linocin/CFP29 family protein
MEELLLRDDAPFGHEVWERIDGLVVSVMRSLLVGRRFVDLVGPLGWGVEQAPLHRYGTEDDFVVADEVATYISLIEWRQDFRLRGRQLALAEHTPYGLDVNAAAIAAQKLAAMEDTQVIGGLLEQAPKRRWATGAFWEGHSPPSPRGSPGCRRRVLPGPMHW